MTSSFWRNALAHLHAQAYVIPASADTTGHSRVGLARFYQDRLARVLANTPRR